MRLLVFLARRLLFLIPQLIGISLVVFFLLRLIPGDPAYKIAGVSASEETLAAIRQQLGLDQPLPVQYLLYLSRVLQGDLGYSWYTSNPVTKDLWERVPATLELITIGLLVSVVVMVPIGVVTAIRRGGIAERGSFFYGLLAGALPDFWLALILVFIFFATLHIAPAPLGRLDIGIDPPARVTGFYTVDSILTLNWTAFSSAVGHLILPVATLVFVYGGSILKMTRGSMAQALESDYVEHQRAAGLSNRKITASAFRNAAPPVVTTIGVALVYLLGGAVLVEAVFGWGGVGQYAVQSIINSDFAPIQGFVLVAAVFSLLVYLVVDLIYVALDPRMSL
jgi:ABC-type dipeptide/oligopeptide/nickel transport system permease component